MAAESPDPSRREEPALNLLESWKSIARYLRRDIRTLQRWEHRRKLPIHRLPGEGKASVYALKTELEAWRQRITTQSWTGPDVSGAASIAVLPFANWSGAKDHAYFSEGLVDSIITGLTRVAGLQVAARPAHTEMQTLWGDVHEIGARLHAGTLLEGSAQIAGSRVRVSAQLVQTATGYLLWSERYDRDLTDEFAAQDEISRAIVKAVRLRIGGAHAC